MTKPENDDSFPEKKTWGTWEELLLACAIHRHGTESWSSVSAEIQKRSPTLRTLTASACRHKYLDLKRRFTLELALSRSGELEWVEELRKLRVDELRREVEQYDLIISSLQSKVKRLEEERDVSLTERDTEIENSDLNNIVEKKERRREPDRNYGEPVPKPPVQSVNESISPDPKGNSPGTGSENANRSEEMDGVLNGEQNGSGDGGEAKPAREDSCRGSCESVEKESAANSERVEPGRGTELTESIAESDGGVNRDNEEWKETSDVQSSASLPRKGTTEQEEHDNEDQSPSTKDFLVESQPSISLVEILLSHPCGSHFPRRLESQETPEYCKIIREHVDFEIILKRVEEGCYKSSKSKFFRDLLLLINNVRVFYHKGSSEFKSAEKLHQLIKKHMTTLKNPREKSLELIALKEAVSVSSKPRMSVPIIACRKRSSLAVKPEPEKKCKKTDHVIVEEKPVSDDESLISKMTTRGRTSSTKKVTIKNSDDITGGFSIEVKKSDEEKKCNTNSKKKSAASFLKRMEVGSLSDTVVETLKPSSSVIGKKREKRNREAGEKESNSSSSSSSTRLKKRVRR